MLLRKAVYLCTGYQFTTYATGENARRETGWRQALWEMYWRAVGEPYKDRSVELARPVEGDRHASQDSPRTSSPRSYCNLQAVTDHPPLPVWESGHLPEEPFRVAIHGKRQPVEPEWLSGSTYRTMSGT